MIFIDFYDLDIKLEFKYYPSTEELFSQKELLGNSRYR